MPKLLNLGCGKRFHPQWVNLDISPADPSVVAWDVSGKIPFAAGSFDFCYASHLLEHLPRAAAPEFLSDCHRLLAPGGVVRIVVPDLEEVARSYLASLERAVSGQGGPGEYEWSVLELLDQMVRVRSGGEVPAYLAAASPQDLERVRARWGREAAAIEGAAATARGAVRAGGWKARLRALRWRIAGLNEADGAAAQFRALGEVHQWMYDRYSLKRLLLGAGFEEPVQRAANESALEGWARFELDADAAGQAHKPDSLFMEARKPLA